MRLGGGTQVILRAAVAGQAAKVAQSVGLATGAEMRAARRAAEQVGAVLVLGKTALVLFLQPDAGMGKRGTRDTQFGMLPSNSSYHGCGEKC